MDLPENDTVWQALSEVGSLSDGKYQIVSIERHDSLDSASQEAWRKVACDHPPVITLYPRIAWEEVSSGTQDAPLEAGEQ